MSDTEHLPYTPRDGRQAASLRAWATDGVSVEGSTPDVDEAVHSAWYAYRNAARATTATDRLVWLLHAARNLSMASAALSPVRPLGAASAARERLDRIGVWLRDEEHAWYGRVLLAETTLGLVARQALDHVPFAQHAGDA